MYLVVALGDRFRLANHLGYFTVLSNIFAACVMLLGVFGPVSPQIRGAAVLYTATTGIVYAILLRSHGYGDVALTCVSVAVILGALAFFVSWTGTKLAQRSSAVMSHD